MKKRLYLLPTYISSLKYYEKLLPRLNERYDVCFLIIRPDDQLRRGMLGYCEARDLPYIVLDAGLTKGGRRIPFMSALMRRRSHQRACHALFQSSPSATLVAMKAVGGFVPAFKEANRLGFNTIVLQTSLTPPPDFYRPEPRVSARELVYRAYYALLSIASLISDILSQGWSFMRTSAHPKRVGVIGPEGVSIFHKRFGFDPAAITVVGTADYQRISELSGRVREDRLLRDALLVRYGLEPAKKRILIMSVWFAHHGAARHSHLYSPAEVERQITHYRRLIEAIREHCSIEEYDILFKLHPAEENRYEGYTAYGVKFFGDEALSEELLALSDLYIADPCTSANYMVVASGVPAIFDNTEGLPQLNKCQIFYPMRRITQNFNEFRNALNSFKEGTLDLGYDESAVDRRSIDKIVSFISE